MSVKWMSYVWENATSVQGTDLLVLLCLADHSQDEDPVSWPSVGRIAARVRRDERTVQRSLARLDRQGWITRDPRDHQSTVYRLRTPDTHVTPVNVSPPTRVSPLGDTRDASRVTAVSPRTVIEPSVEPSVGDAQTNTSVVTPTSPVPEWVQRIPWLDPDKWAMVLTFAHHVDPLGSLGTFIAWCDEHPDTAQSFTRFWQWLAKDEADAKAMTANGNMHDQFVRFIRSQPIEETQ